ncbi:hypothetical protein MES4922_380034 [Mesorhizobium ventifaucium]|uniref:Uncharacterized protein n=1 Tax=Mesorhizobium ventifaucium TaxID=666020 RepID=A0ABM9E713_9HYPH|nr:hypothetical protein MES4922_380034 [Mesorhizobium ventifaucium]
MAKLVFVHDAKLLILITDEKGAAASKLDTIHTIVLPATDEIIAAMMFSLPIKLLA